MPSPPPRTDSPPPPRDLSPSCPLSFPVYGDGKICLDILQKEWSPLLDVAATLTSIQSLLCDPNPASPANVEAANAFKDDPIQYLQVRALIYDHDAHDSVWRKMCILPHSLGPDT